jgi:hypothetical protein
VSRRKKEEMARGGYRPGSCRKAGTKGIKKGTGAKKTGDAADSLTPDEKKDADAQELSPLEYMLKIMNDPNADKNRRDRMAQAAAPFVHARKGEGSGKKDEKDSKAKAAAKGRFATSEPPSYLRAVK